MTSSQGIKLLALTFPLFFLLHEALMAVSNVSTERIESKDENPLLCVDCLEFNSLVRVDSTAGRAAFVEIFLDMMPTEATNLGRYHEHSSTNRRKREDAMYLVPADARLEIQI